ncbi:hypothetical protein [Vagococcus acidifermentans]|uniref:Uncharacterized protein n=1 Tax=Vagococcus acidifermentans TaxID=564710 RepID=A0A430AWU8_9ENTE|nr:hypothetical protein [Vagococcus acidifermentans]RSU12530.1 hypothetical protein CBF27_06025 [Vagococcus acidifermentans]
MHQALVRIVQDRIQEQFINEELFCKHYLQISTEVWWEWQKGRSNLPADVMQKMKGLFSDYEWMLVQKIIRQTILFPEKRNYVVSEYKRLKAIIAKKWLHSDEADVELVSKKSHFPRQSEQQVMKHTVNLRVVMSYGEWGYDDILEFFMPAVIQQQIEDASVDLLEWVDENLEDTYMADEVSAQEE